MVVLEKSSLSTQNRRQIAVQKAARQEACPLHPLPFPYGGIACSTAPLQSTSPPAGQSKIRAEKKFSARIFLHREVLPSTAVPRSQSFFYPNQPGAAGVPDWFPSGTHSRAHRMCPPNDTCPCPIRRGADFGSFTPAGSNHTPHHSTVPVFSPSNAVSLCLLLLTHQSAPLISCPRLPSQRHSAAAALSPSSTPLTRSGRRNAPFLPIPFPFSPVLRQLCPQTTEHIETALLHARQPSPHIRGALALPTAFPNVCGTPAMPADCRCAAYSRFQFSVDVAPFLHRSHRKYLAFLPAPFSLYTALFTYFPAPSRLLSPRYPAAGVRHSAAKSLHFDPVTRRAGGRCAPRERYSSPLCQDLSRSLSEMQSPPVSPLRCFRLLFLPTLYIKRISADIKKAPRFTDGAPSLFSRQLRRALLSSKLPFSERLLTEPHPSPALRASPLRPFHQYSGRGLPLLQLRKYRVLHLDGGRLAAEVSRTQPLLQHRGHRALNHRSALLTAEAVPQQQRT